VGSVFNLDGLQRAFPMRPSEAPGFSLLSHEEARAQARRIGVPLTTVPSVARLSDGSALVATSERAVALSHLSPSCVASLTEIGGGGELFRSTAAAAAVVALQPLAEEACETLRRALAIMPAPNGCDASLAAAATRAATLLGRREAAARASQRAELAYAQHAEQLRALRRDLGALEASLQVDAAAAGAARDRHTALLRSSAEPLAAAAWELSQRLARLGEVAGRLLLRAP
jgi:hypothetical protein